MALIDSIIVFLVGLGIGGLGIYLGALLVLGASEYTDAIVTALVGAVVWSIVGFFFGWLPLLGPALGLIAWLSVINWRYPGDWIDALAIALVAWVSVLVILYVLAIFNLGNFGVIGVPTT